ncbi:MAG: acyl carrier protein [Candidatus Ancaeobacter aquaticus]|nr:acyl carrier protein [Candidatus Ancaeobacter aquaticus]
MKVDNFMDELKEALEIEDEDQEITLETNLKELEEYDSLSVLSIIAMIDKNFSKQIPSSDFIKITTIKSLIDLIGKEHFE